jgi:pimeloyl-ACP methyl ester carboxylesterase
MIPARRQIVRTNGVELSCLVAGDRGELVVLLHGFPQSSYEWRHQIPALAGRYRVVAPDLRGYGESSKPTGISAYRSTVLADDIVGLIRAFGADRAHVVGHDWGGAIALTLALEHPEVLGRLVVINCPHPAAMARALRSDPRQLARSWYVFAFQLRWLPERQLTRPGAISSALRRSARDPGAFAEADLAEYERAFARPHVARAALAYYRAAFRDRIRGRGVGTGRRIEAPTLVIWGEEDLALGKGLTFGMERYFSGPFAIRYVPGCGHWVPEERPAQTSEWLLEFFNGGDA